MKADGSQIEGGLWGLLVGDAVGVPYEFHPPEALPPLEKIDMLPPANFSRSYSHITSGTWSDDGAQALCLAASLLHSAGWNARDFSTRLLRWRNEGYMAVGGRVFDIGIQTGEALDRLAEGGDPEASGLGGERNNGNGSLMRCLPLALLGPESDEDLVAIAHAQSRITHAHLRSQVCCALYTLWAREEMARTPASWDHAVERLREIYTDSPEYLRELEQGVLSASDRHPEGSGYVVDCLFSARFACLGNDYATIVRRAIALGYDTDTTACVAGGIAGIRYGKEGIPSDWRNLLQGQELLEDLLALIRNSPGH